MYGSTYLILACVENVAPSLEILLFRNVAVIPLSRIGNYRRRAAD